MAAPARPARATRSRSGTCPTTTCRSPGPQGAGLPPRGLVPVPVRLLRAEFQQPAGRADPAPALLPPGVPASRRPAGLDSRLLRRARSSHLRPGACGAGQPVFGRQRLCESLSLQRRRGAGAARRARLEGRRQRGHHLCPAGHGAERLREGHRCGRRAQLHAHVPERARLYRRRHGGPAVCGQAGGHRDHPQGGDDDHDRRHHPELRGGPGGLQLAARPVRGRLGVQAGPLPDRRGDLPDRRPRKRRQLLGPDDRQADRRHDQDAAGGCEGRARRLPGPGPSRAARLLAAEPGHARDGPVDPRRFRPNAYGFINPEEWYFTKAAGAGSDPDREPGRRDDRLHAAPRRPGRDRPARPDGARLRARAPDPGQPRARHPRAPGPVPARSPRSTA